MVKYSLHDHAGQSWTSNAHNASDLENHIEGGDDEDGDQREHQRWKGSKAKDGATEIIEQGTERSRCHRRGIFMLKMMTGMTNWKKTRATALKGILSILSKTFGTKNMECVGA
jgi:hypothetical protein